MGHPAIPLQSDHAGLMAASGATDICDSLDWLRCIGVPITAFFLGFFADFWFICGGKFYCLSSNRFAEARHWIPCGDAIHFWSPSFWLWIRIINGCI